MKICRNCQYFGREFHDTTCYHPLALKSVHIVTGHPDRMTASEMRSQVTLCGRDGNLYEEPETFLQKVSRTINSIWK